MQHSDDGLTTTLAIFLMVSGNLWFTYKNSGMPNCLPLQLYYTYTSVMLCVCLRRRGCGEWPPLFGLKAVVQTQEHPPRLMCSWEVINQPISLESRLALYYFHIIGTIFIFTNKYAYRSSTIGYLYLIVSVILSYLIRNRKDYFLFLLKHLYVTG
jgi:hypothetical protein